MRYAYDLLAETLSRSGLAFGLLSQQASPLADILHAAAPRGFKCLFSAEHGFFGTAAPGEKTSSCIHPDWNIPVHALYGATRHPTPEMFDGLDAVIVDLLDLGVRCYTYLATLKNMLEGAAARNVAVLVCDHPVPLGGVTDGPLLDPKFSSFVAPANVPLCHGMTLAEEALFLARDLPDARVTPLPLRDWSHADRAPWPDFMPPSPGIRSWDSAVLYPLTVFTEAYPALGTDRAGNLAFRVLHAPWLDVRGILKDVAEALAERGVAARAFRVNGDPGILFSVADPSAYRPVEAGLMTLFAILKRHPDEMAAGARPEWLAKLLGTDAFASVHSAAALERLFGKWRTDRTAYDPVNLYASSYRRLR